MRTAPSSSRCSSQSTQRSYPEQDPSHRQNGARLLCTQVSGNSACVCVCRKRLALSLSLLSLIVMHSRGEGAFFAR